MQLQNIGNGHLLEICVGGGVLWEEEHVCLKTVCWPNTEGFSEQDLCGRSYPSPTYVPSGLLPATHTSQTLTCLHHISVCGGFILVPETCSFSVQGTRSARELMPSD